jgi:hypothetical protein
MDSCFLVVCKHNLNYDSLGLFKEVYEKGEMDYGFPYGGIK